MNCFSQTIYGIPAKSPFRWTKEMQVINEKTHRVWTPPASPSQKIGLFLIEEQGKLEVETLKTAREDLVVSNWQDGIESYQQWKPH